MKLKFLQTTHQENFHFVPGEMYFFFFLPFHSSADLIYLFVLVLLHLGCYKKKIPQTERLLEDTQLLPTVVEIGKSRLSRHWWLWCQMREDLFYGS